MADGEIDIVSWNVNGLRAAERKGFRRWLDKRGAFVVGVQEVRAKEEQLSPALRRPKGWTSHFVAAERAGYSGVGLYCRDAPTRVTTSLGVKALDVEGRVQIAEMGALVVANVYFPNGNGKARDNSRVPFKLRFTRRVERVLLERYGLGSRVLVMGDFNTAREDIDLARPKQNRETSGFLPEERRELDRWVRRGWVDSFRQYEPGGGHYSWWAQRAGLRGRNVGWRIDYVMASPGAVPFLRGAAIERDTLGSDHCPVSVRLDRAVLG